ncbi:MAG: hypothetical protein IPM15_09790 [Betaproteobacteria bacterium]|nr:hypothetical protein [Betaproteobacteria bacterium]MCC6249508.1 hypothetical protein [Rubrivivax sp.]MCL4698024.1 hypothetical protein [Burkholderiaceae bacterium]
MNALIATWTSTTPIPPEMPPEIPTPTPADMPPLPGSPSPDETPPEIEDPPLPGQHIPRKGRWLH